MAGGGEYGELGDGEYGDGALLGEDVGVIGEEAGRSGGGTGAGIEDSGRDDGVIVGPLGCCPTARDGTGDLLDPDACGAGAGALLSPPDGF